MTVRASKLGDKPKYTWEDAVRRLSDASKTLPCEPYDIHLFDFPREAVTGIIVGARVNQTTVDAIATLRKTIAEYAYIPLKKALPDPHHFLLQIVNEVA